MFHFVSLIHECIKCKINRPTQMRRIPALQVDLKMEQTLRPGMLGIIGLGYKGHSQARLIVLSQVTGAIKHADRHSPIPIPFATGPHLFLAWHTGKVKHGQRTSPLIISFHPSTSSEGETEKMDPCKKEVSRWLGHASRTLHLECTGSLHKSSISVICITPKHP